MNVKKELKGVLHNFLLNHLYILSGATPLGWFIPLNKE